MPMGSLACLVLPKRKEKIEPSPLGMTAPSEYAERPTRLTLVTLPEEPKSIQVCYLRS